MKHLTTLLCACLGLPSLLFGQTASERDFGFTPQFDPITQQGDLSWWGQEDRTFFLQMKPGPTPDLGDPWVYVPLIEYGTDEIIQWSISTDPSTETGWYRLEYAHIPTEDPFNSDYDLDEWSNWEEVNLNRSPLDFYNGSPAEIQIVSGNNQGSLASEFLANPLVVSVRNSNGVLLRNKPDVVTFKILSGGGQLSESDSGTDPLVTTLTASTDASGNAQAYLRLPASIASIRVEASTTNTQLIASSVIFDASAGNPNLAPAAPTGVAVGEHPDGGLLVRWQDASNNETSFTIQRRVGTGVWTTVGSVNPNVSEFTDESATDSVTYIYRIVADNTNGNGGAGNDAFSIPTTARPFRDHDSDGLTNSEEARIETDPDNPNTDNDPQNIVDGRDAWPLLADFAPARKRNPSFMAIDLELPENEVPEIQQMFINDKNQIAIRLPEKAYFWENGQLTELELPEELIADEPWIIPITIAGIGGLNNNGEVVGYLSSVHQEVGSESGTLFPPWFDATEYLSHFYSRVGINIPFVWKKGVGNPVRLLPANRIPSDFEPGSADPTLYTSSQSYHIEFAENSIRIDDDGNVIARANVEVDETGYEFQDGQPNESHEYSISNKYSSTLLWTNPFSQARAVPFDDESIYEKRIDWIGQEIVDNRIPMPDILEVNLLGIAFGARKLSLTSTETELVYADISQSAGFASLGVEGTSLTSDAHGHVYVGDYFLRNVDTGPLDNQEPDGTPSWNTIQLVKGVNKASYDNPKPLDVHSAFEGSKEWLDAVDYASNKHRSATGTIWHQALDQNGNPVGEPVQKAVLFLAYEVVEINEDETTTPLGEIRMSSPSPTVTLSSITLDDLEPDSAGEALVASMNITGEVRSDVCDISGQANAKIDSMRVYINDADEPVEIVNLNVSKTTQSVDTSLRRPYPYLGTFSNATLSDVPLTEGINTIRFEVTDPLFGAVGSCVYTVNVTATPVGDFEQDLSAQVSFAGDLSNSVIDTLDANISIDGTPTGINTYTETGVNTREFTSTTGLTIKLFVDGAPFDSGSMDSFSVSISGPSIFDGIGIVGIEEGSASSLVFTGSTTLTRFPEDYTEFDLAMTEPVLVTPSTRGEYHPLALCFGEQGSFVSGMQFQMADGWTEVVQSEVDGLYYLRMNNVGRFLIHPFMKAVANADIDPEELELILADVQNYDYSEFLIGYAIGFGWGAWELVKSVGDTIEMISVVNQWMETEGNVAVIAFRWGVGAEAFPMTMSFLRAGEGTARSVGDVMFQLYEAAQHGSDAYFLAVLANEYEEADEIGRQMQEFKAFAADVFWDSLEYYNEHVPEREQGLYAGRLAFELVSLFVTWETLPAMALTKVNFLARLSQKAFLQLEKNQGLIKVFAKLIEKYQTMRFCFVAGTLIHTAHGLQAIETVRPGDLVWSRDPQTHSVSLKPVLDTAVTHPTALYHVRYASGDSSASTVKELICTAEHPFFVSQRGQFVPAEDLQQGNTLILLDGNTATVQEVKAQRSVGIPFTTYNFEVADSHTYFVGQDGVWVHNFSDRFCDKFFQLLEFTRNKMGIEDVSGKRFQILEEALKTTKIDDVNSGNYVVFVTGDESLADYAIRHATPSGGDPGSEIYSYTKQRSLVSKFGAGIWEIHHLVEKRFSRALGIPQSAWDSSPSLNLPTRINGGHKSMLDADLQKFRDVYGRDPVTHRGPNGIKEAIDDIFRNNGFPDDRPLNLPEQQQKLINDLHQLYAHDARYSHLNAWPATRDWLKAQLPGTSLNIPN